jgi:hypothetical protein
MVQPLTLAESVEAATRNRPRFGRFLGARLSAWLKRHRHTFNLAIHVLGIPMALAGVVCMFLLPWYWGVGLFVGGYLLQFIGHQIEGNDVGEWAGIKRLLGLPYTGISPRWETDQPAATR